MAGYGSGTYGAGTYGLGQTVMGLISGPGPVRKAVRFSGQYYSAAGTGANVTVKTGRGLLNSIITIGTGNVTVLDGSNQMFVLLPGVPYYPTVEFQTSLVVNGANTLTSISITYD